MDNTHPRLQVRVDLTLGRVLLLIPSIALGGLAVVYLLLVAVGLAAFASAESAQWTLLLAPVGVAGFMGLGRPVGRRPVLELDHRGIRVRPPWPVPRRWDRMVTWDQLDRLEAASLYLNLRGYWLRFDHFWVVPNPGIPVEVSWWDRIICFLGPGSRPEEGYRVGVSRGWTRPVEDVVAFARRFHPHLPFIDARMGP